MEALLRPLGIGVEVLFTDVNAHHGLAQVGGHLSQDGGVVVMGHSL